MTDSHQKISHSNFRKVYEPAERTSVQFIYLFPTEGSWRNVLYTLLRTQFSRLILNFTVGLQTKSVTFYFCFTRLLCYILETKKLSLSEMMKNYILLYKCWAVNKRLVQINAGSTRSSFK